MQPRLISCYFRAAGAPNNFLPAHERAQDLRHGDGSVRLLVVLQDRDDPAGRRHRTRVERVGNEFVPTDLPRADVQAPRLVVRAVAATDDLAVLLLPRKPRLDVVLLRGDRADVPRADVDDAVWNLQGAIDRLAVRSELLVPRPTVLRPGEDELLDLVELVHPEEALRVDAVPADLPAELRRDARQPDREAGVVDHLVHEHRAHRMFRRRDQVK